MQSSGGKIPVSHCPGENFMGGNYPRSSFPGENYAGAVVWG